MTPAFSDGGGAGVTPGPPVGGGSQTTTPSAKATLADACRDRLWLVRTGTTRSFPLLGLTQKRVLTCLGRPTSAARRGTVTRWRYGKHLEMRFKAGKVYLLVLRDGQFASAPDGLRVGSNCVSTLPPFAGARAWPRSRC